MVTSQGKKASAITALKKSKKRVYSDLVTSMEASYDGIAITDAQGRYIFMNEAHLAFFGYTSEAEVIGKPWQALYSPDTAAWISASAMPHLIRKGNWSGEILGVARDGSPVDLEISLTQKDDGGILCISRDMRERRREAAERDRLREELQRAQHSEIIGQIAAGLAHDFNNLLATISGGALLIKETAAPTNLITTGAERIQVATERAEILVKRLLSLGRREADPISLDIRLPLQEATDLVRASLRGPIEIDLSLPDGPINVVADPTDILQTVLILATNARDALEGKSGTISIVLTLPVQEDLDGPFIVGTPNLDRDYCKVTVADTGPGTTQELITGAFTPNESASGAGLGLAIASTKIKEVQGTIKLETAPGQGTLFSILWPMSPEAASEAEILEGLTGRLDGRTILVVDDHAEMLRILTAFLESAGAEVAPSTQPEDIIEALRDDPDGWDLLITDFDMPTTSGAELAQQIRPYAPQLPIILVTAQAGMAGRDTSAFEAVIGKPIEKFSLVKTAEAAIVKSKLKI